MFNFFKNFFINTDKKCMNVYKGLKIQYMITNKLFYICLKLLIIYMYNFILSYAFELNIFTKTSQNHENRKFLYVSLLLC